MKKLWLLLAIAVPLQPVCSQEVRRAPTVERCRADQKLWLSMLEKGPEGPVAKVAFREFEGWQHEMNECSRVDPDNYEEYFKTGCASVAAAGDRIGNFIGRHNLWSQFLAEDAQGKR
jgi:hypothetical protein